MSSRRDFDASGACGGVGDLVIITLFDLRSTSESRLSSYRARITTTCSDLFFG